MGTGAVNFRTETYTYKRGDENRRKKNEYNFTTIVWRAMNKTNMIKKKKKNQYKNDTHSTGGSTYVRHTTAVFCTEYYGLPCKEDNGTYIIYSYIHICRYIYILYKRYKDQCIYIMYLYVVRTHVI